jgi:hypothetical protein
MKVWAADISDYHSLYSILNFDWLIYLQITVCKYRSGANTSLIMRTLKMIRQLKLKKYHLLSWNVNMTRLAELSESDLSSLLEEKDAENTNTNR